MAIQRIPTAHPDPAEAGAPTSRNAWYETAVPIADDLYDKYLDELRHEGLI